MVILSWPQCDLFDSRVEKVCTKIESQCGHLVRDVSSGQKAYRLLRRYSGLSPADAVERLRNVFISASGDATAVSFHLTEAGRLDRGGVLSRLDQILKSEKIDPQLTTYAGLGHNLHTLNQEGLESPFRVVPQIMLLAFVLTVVLVRSFWLAFFINALGAYTGCLSFNIVWLADVDMNAIIWPLPTLTMLLTVSAAMHFLSYYRKSAESHQPTAANVSPGEGLNDLALRAHRRTIARSALWASAKPIFCCTLTTSIGLLSLLLSSSAPVQQFGMFGALSIAAANVLLLVWFPPFLTVIGHADRIEKHVDSQSPSQNPHPLPPHLPDRWWHWTRFTRNYCRLIFAACLILLFTVAWGIPKITTGSALSNFFPAGHRVLDSVKKMQTRVGPLNAVELLLTFDNVNRHNDRTRIRGLQVLMHHIESTTAFESCTSAGTFAPQLDRHPQGVRKAIQDSRLKRFKEEIHGSLLHKDTHNRQETWRVSCRYSIFKNIDLTKQTEQLKQIVDTVFAPNGRLLFPEESLTVTTTGEFLLFDVVDQQFLSELLWAYLTAFFAIAVVVLILLKSLKAALIALLPNLFPAVVVLGGAGLLGYPLDVASLMTASVALGIAVDDTIHFLLWHQEVDRSNLTQRETIDPIDSAMRYCGQAMIQTSLVIGISISLYAFCGFLPTVRFGILLSAMMLAALIGDLLLLPALMAIFGSREGDTARHESADQR